ncbi:DMAP1-binding protein [Stenotrophomonas maltophilia]|uniref:gas vesicle protein GvpG n=1 Tax=Stenotrophomonas chelatiphaga TaxID=517011 RepID=UPI000F4C16F7|nr:gas vesicle protein GvpG [Stenotrophomonas chelatiphaga]MCS4230363.1 hypothetical protein [Stenotrophomonas chelatiphaga]ROQ40294.1 DMAP1-binding protein [Stenotrophomonas maltophilia]
MEILGVGHWMIWIIGVVVFGALIVWLALAAFREKRRAPELPSAAARVSRELQLPEAVQAELAALNQRKDDGRISEAEYEQARARLLDP